MHKYLPTFFAFIRTAMYIFISLDNSQIHLPFPLMTTLHAESPRDTGTRASRGQEVSRRERPVSSVVGPGHSDPACRQSRRLDCTVMPGPGLSSFRTNPQTSQPAILTCHQTLWILCLSLSYISLLRFHTALLNNLFDITLTLHR